MTKAEALHHLLVAVRAHVAQKLPGFRALSAPLRAYEACDDESEAATTGPGTAEGQAQLEDTLRDIRREGPT